MKLDFNLSKLMILGSSIFATGGGIDASTQLNMLRKFEKTKIPYPNLIEVGSLGDEDLVACVYGIGPAGEISDTIALQAKKAITHLQKMYKKNLSGIFPVETGIEMMMIPLCGSLDIPLLDADVVGGRAVPELIYDNFLLQDQSIFPLIAVDANMVVHTFQEQDIALLDEKLRTLVLQTGGSLICVDHISSAATLVKTGSLGVLTRSIQSGELISQSTLIQDFSGYGDIIFEGTILDTSLQVTGGFRVGEIVIGNGNNPSWLITVKNEYMYATNGSITASFPDLITIIDKKTGIGLGSNQVKSGDEVVLAVIGCEERWRDFEYTPE